MSTANNPLSLSDEDFRNSPPPEMKSEEEAAAETNDEGTDEAVQEGQENDPAGSTDGEADPTDVEENEAEGSEDQKDGSDDEDEAGGEADSTDTPADGEGKPGKDDDGKKAGETSDTGAKSEKDDKPAGDPKSGEDDGDKDQAKTDPAPVVTAKDHETFYNKVMAPFKANGKMIHLKSPEEAIQLMQMGANYTRKLQDIQPHRKVLMMLENNGLLDQGKLSYLIDLDKKEPRAIQKLLKDSGIDPLEIDTDSADEYRPGNHQVSDEEAKFVETMESVSSRDRGAETIQIINQTWDAASKQALWASPEIMTTIQDQRETGVYDRIVAEMDRQITLGQIPTTTPFLEAYRSVGEKMVQANAFSDLGQQPSGDGAAPAIQQPARKVAEKVAAPKPKVKSGDKAEAAGTSRSTPRKAEKLVNPLAMSDEEFLKSMADRL